MAPLKDFEANNANQWDSESIISAEIETTKSLQTTVQNVQNASTPDILINFDPELQTNAVQPRTPQVGPIPSAINPQVTPSAGRGRQVTPRSASDSTSHPLLGPSIGRQTFGSYGFADGEGGSSMSELKAAQTNMTAIRRGRGHFQNQSRGPSMHTDSYASGTRGPSTRGLSTRGISRGGFSRGSPGRGGFSRGSPGRGGTARPSSSAGSTVECFNCGETGHFKLHCNNPGNPNANAGRNNTQSPRGRGRKLPGDGKKNWAVGAPLITTAHAAHLEKIAQENAERMIWLDQGEDEGEYPGNGFYLWPKFDERPQIIFGSGLEKLDIIRTTHKVWIKWHEPTRCLKVSTKSIKHADHAIAAAIESIRNFYHEANAREVRATALNLVHPPDTKAISSIVRPKTVFRDPDVASDFELVGDKLSADEEAAWEDARQTKINSNFDRFEKHMKEHLLAIAPLKGWMRMRVHFGHLEIKVFRDDFAEGKFSFEQFDAMLQKARTRTELNKHLGNPLFANLIIETICDAPETFCPVNGKYPSLREVQWMDTEILFAKLPGDEDNTLRIEAEVEHMYEQAGYECQPGPVKAYYEKRNQIVEIRAIDIEKKLDWSLDVISENCLERLPRGVEKIIKDSISVKTMVAQDRLGLEYPRVTPRSVQGGIQITSTILRSVIQFQLCESGYVVEISVYRKWKGSDTQAEPSLDIAVTMFHQDWDREMESLEGTLDVREWEEDLSNFFKGNDSNIGGLECFVNEIRKVQLILVDVATLLSSKN